MLLKGMINSMLWSLPYSIEDHCVFINHWMPNYQTDLQYRGQAHFDNIRFIGYDFFIYNMLIQHGEV